VSDQHVYGKENLRLMLNASFNRSKIVLSTDSKLSSLANTKATLIRPTVPFFSASIDEKYELQSNFKEKVELTYLEGKHFTILENPELLRILHGIHAMLVN